MSVLELSKALGNVTAAALLETLTLETIHEKISEACKLSGVEFIPSLIHPVNIRTLRFNLTVILEAGPIIEHFGLSYDRDQSTYLRTLSAYTDAPTFKLDAVNWVDTNKHLSLPIFYTFGPQIITSLTRSEFLKVSMDYQKSLLIGSGFTPQEVKEMDYTKGERLLREVIAKTNYTMELIKEYSK